MRGSLSGPKKAGMGRCGPNSAFWGIFLFLTAPVLKNIFQTSFLVQGSFSALPLERCVDCRNLSLKVDFPSSIFSLDNPYLHLFSLLLKTQQNQETKSDKIRTKFRQKFRQNSDNKIQTTKFRQKSDTKFRHKFRQNSGTFRQIQTCLNRPKHFKTSGNTKF